MKSPFRTTLPGGWPEDAPPRSILYSLPPYGCSGEDRESLGNYILRLSAAHDMARWTLTNRIIGPAAQELFGASSDRMARDVGRADYGLIVSSHTEQAHQWAHTLNALTLRTNLQLCTLLPLRGVVSAFVLLSHKRRFCPRCYEDDLRGQRDCYDRLLWSIEAVAACPLHRMKLVNRPKLKRRASNLGQAESPSRQVTENAKSIESAPLLPASDYEVESARLIAELLDDAVVFADAGHATTAQSAFLTHAVDTLFKGKYAPFAAHLRVSKSQLHGWMKGQVRMSLPRLALVAYCCGCAIADILLGNRVMLSLLPAPRCQNRRLIASGGEGAKRPKEDLRRELDELIRDGRVNNATEAARTLEVSSKFLRRNFPIEQALLVQNGKEIAEARRKATTAEFDQVYLTEHRALWDAGVYPARRRVLERMHGKVESMGRRENAERAQRKAHAETGVMIARVGGGASSRQSRGRTEIKI
ncbi:TniQ family protein [Paraburkholderia strydomiana]|uniref:TniQ family protein n=1 Tax=Paraburkholderia strydomiana TaxID=1245417 RepID=UPI0038BCA362